MQIDNGYFYETEPVVDLEHFVELLLATLAFYHDNINIYFKTETRNAELPITYKENIEDAMYSESDKTIKFLQLIDYYQYYEHQAYWEENLAEAFNNYLKNNNKTAKYNFNHDTIEVSFTLEEVKKILEKYDKETQEIMGELSLFLSEKPAFERKQSLIKQQNNNYLKKRYLKTGPYTYCKDWMNKQLK